MVNIELEWEARDGKQRAPYFSARGAAPPKRAVSADDTLTADDAFRLVSQGTAVVWLGDYHNARQLLEALGRRIDKRLTVTSDPSQPAKTFNAYRQVQSQRAALLSLLLIPITEGGITLSRAPKLGDALTAPFGELGEVVMPLIDILGAISAREWRSNGVEIKLLGQRIHPHYGVFPPTRQDYLDLVYAAPLPTPEGGLNLAYDLGIGSGVLSAALLHRGVPFVVGTDTSPRAIACAADNLQRLGYADRSQLIEGTLYPSGQAGLIVCNPPWLPGKAGTSLESAVYDPDSQMLRGFLAGLPEHLSPSGEGWLILSDLAEHLGLRTRADLLELFASANLRILARHDTTPSSKAARDTSDPLYFARSKEVVSLWRLGL